MGMHMPTTNYYFTNFIQQKMKVYAINRKLLTEGRTSNLDFNEISDDTFIYLAGSTGNDWYSIKEFETMYNNGEVDYENSFIRFID